MRRQYGWRQYPGAEPAEFEELVARAVDDLPDWVREQMDNVAITVAPWPSPEQAERAQARGARLLLGLYEGVPLTRRGGGYHLVAPDRITLFQGPLEMTARSDEALLALVRKTILHEIAHHFGFGEDQIRELGV